MKRILVLALLLSSVFCGAQTDYDFSRLKMEDLGRGVAAVRRSPSEVFVSWRYLSGDPSDISFNVYRDGVLLEGMFMRRKANLVLYPVSVENRNIAYAAISFTVRGDNLNKFVEKSVMPVVHRYARKYGEYRITHIDRRYEQADRKTTGQEYGRNRHIISFEFEDPEILLRAQTDRDCRFNIVIQYINTVNLARQLLESPHDYHYCPNPPPPPPHHRRHHRR